MQPTALSNLDHAVTESSGSESIPTSHNSRTYTTILLSISMSQTRPTSTSSNNFQFIFNNALKAYERRTKKDILLHPLAAQLQSCDSHSSILIVLQQQVQDLNQSQSSDERLTKWLDPTVKVLYTLSETLGEGVSLVCPRYQSVPRSLLSILQVFSPAKAIFVGIGVLLSVCILLDTLVRSIVIRTALRQPRMFVRDRTLFWRSSSA